MAQEEQKPPVNPKSKTGQKVTTHICPVCNKKFYHRGKYDTRACKQKAYRERMKENDIPTP